ncbi:MAG: hypothetical protein Q8K67_14540 [Geothrix sp.]|nr:hypothetical protein [Geothrix sp.]
MRLIKSLILAGIVASVGVSGEVPKTLPEAFYSTAKAGKKIDLLVVDPAYDKSKGFIFDGKVDYQAELRDTAMSEAIGIGVKEIATPGSPYTLKLTLVNLTTATWTGFFNLLGKATVEGNISGADGKILCSFLIKAKVPLKGMAGVDHRGTADTVVTAILKDLK